MVIDIKYNDYTLFDIEFYETKYERAKDENCWYSELHVLPLVEGILRFTNDSINNSDFNLEEFIKDSKEIQELRRLVMEDFDNRITDLDTSWNRHYNVIYPKINDIIDKYVTKYNFYTNID